MSDTANSSAALSAYPATSPCLKVCVLDMGAECRGCRRTIVEIGNWSRMTLDERRAVNQRIGFRGHDEKR
ncbi:DUF1289 domain-containing protein [Gemmatimonas groenlandica]|nr:DUF1289 domain-containing protein [Gemmatimonas groenlandica]